MMSVARMTQKAIVASMRDPWVTRRRIVDTLTPNLQYFGSKKAKMGPDGGSDPATDWLPFVLAIGSGPRPEGAGRGTLSAGMEVW